MTGLQNDLHVHGRAGVTNGRLYPRGQADGRSAGARRLRDLTWAFVREAGGNDLAAFPETERASIRSAAALALRLEQEQARLARGEDVDADLLVRLAAELRLGLDGLRERRSAK